MIALKIILGFIYLLVCAALVVVTLLQESKENGVSALGGQSESFFSKNKGGTREAFLTKLTVVLGVGFAIVAVALTVVLVI